MSDQPKATRPTRKTTVSQDKAHTEALLDEALDETFPASDPPAMTEPAGAPPEESGADEEEPKADDGEKPRSPCPTASALKLRTEAAGTIDQPDQPARNSTMQTQDATPEIPVVMPGYEMLSIATFDMFRTMSDWTAETGGFIGQRLEKDAQLMSSLARCEGVFDATHCLTRFFGTAFEDYAIEAQRINATMGRSMMKAFGDFQEQLSEPKAPAID